MRTVRWGLDGKLIDSEAERSSRSRLIPAARVCRRLVDELAAEGARIHHQILEGGTSADRQLERRGNGRF